VSTLIQRSFSGGELAPSLYARVDVSKYATGVRTLRNMLTMRHGGATNRPGTMFSCEVKDSSKTVRLIPFVFNSAQTYVLEFGDQYMRVIKSGVQQRLASQNITGITNANPCVITYDGADTYANGDEIYITGIVGAIGSFLNNRNFKVANLNAGANTFELDYLDGTNVNSTSMGAYGSGGTIAEVYEISTPYLEADLPTLQFVQSADVVTIVHPSYAPRELSRSGDTSWTLATITFAPTIDKPDGGALSSIAAGANEYRYRVTAIAEETYEESLPGYEAPFTITGVTQANPAVVTTSASHSYNSGEEVYISGIVGMTELNGRKFNITVLTATTFELDSEDSSGYTAYSSGGTSERTAMTAWNAAAPTSANPHIVSWTAVTGAVEYNVYRADGTSGVYGFLGVTRSTTFRDIGSDPDTTDNPPSERDIFNAADDYPSAVTYYQQRLGLASTTNDPEKIWLSRSARFKNFTASNPIQDDDAITFSMTGRQVNRVKHLIDIGRLIVLTSGGEWSVEGGSSGTLAPDDINPRQYSYNGSSDVPPVVINNNAIYCQARGSIIRDLRFDFETDGYSGDDLTIFSAHLFDDYQIVEMAYQQIPHSVLWVVRDDGKLLGLTYVKEQQMYAWHRHDTDGLIENVCVVPEGSEDVLYMTVARTVGAATKRYVERMATRNINLIEDSKFLDSYGTYDGRNTGSTTMTISGSGWTYTDTLTLTASSSTFVSTDVGNEVHVYYTDSDGEEQVIRLEITAYTSATVVSVTPNRTVPVALQAVATTDWALAVDQVTGLWHLNGLDVSVFADGFVVANPNNESYDVRTVSDGTLTLDKPYAVIHVGLPYTSDIETLNIDTAQGETISDKNKLVNKVTLFVEDSRGVWIGPKPPPDEATDFLGGLTEVKVRNDEGYDDPVSLRTGTIDVNIQSEWNSNGRIFIRQTDPLPLSVLAVVPAGLFPFRG
jgi:Ubiquitin-activating enzyme E1 FCCH domain